MVSVISKKWANKQVRWITDNQNVVSNVQHGSPKVVLQVEALEIFLCVLTTQLGLSLNRYQGSKMTIIAILWTMMTG